MRILAICALSFSGAVFLSQYALEPKLNICIAALFFIIGFIGFILKNKRRKIVILTAFSASAGLLYCSLYYAVFIKPAENLAGTVSEISAEAVDFSEEKDYGARITVKIQAPNGTKVKAILYIYDEISEIKPGDKIKLTASMALSNKMYGSNNDNYPSKGVYLFAYQASGSSITIENAEKINFRYIPRYMEFKLKQIADNIFLSKAVPFMKAILLGDRDELYEDNETVKSFQVSGIFHIVAVSGMHISFITGLIVLLCGRNRRATAAIAVPILILYMFLTGAQPSVQRAVIMQIFVIAAPILYRENDSITSISAALMTILLLNPYSAKSIGLQLSFAATFGIILQSGKLYDIILNYKIKEHLRRKVGLQKAASAIAACLAASLSAMIFSLPLTALYFGYVSIIAVITNLFVFPLIAVCFSMGLAALIAGAVFVPAGALVGIMPSFAGEIIIFIAKSLSKIKFAAIYTVNPYITMWLVFMYLIIIISVIFKSKMRGILVTCFIGSISFCLVILISNIRFSNTEMEVTALDVGQGQCIIVNADGKVLMIDCGSSYEDAGKIASEYLLSSGNRKIDVLLMTHFDTDHINGFENLTSEIDITALIIPSPDISDSEIPKEIQSVAENKTIETLIAAADMEITLGKMNISLFAMSNQNYTDENDNGIVVLISKDSFDILVTGDISSKAERELISKYNIPDTEVIITGHHGSKYSTCEEYLRAVNPEIAIISSGYNRYGHPSDEVLQRLENKGITVLRTDLQGNISLRTQ